MFILTAQMYVQNTTGIEESEIHEDIRYNLLSGYGAKMFLIIEDHEPSFDCVYTLNFSPTGSHEIILRMEPAETLQEGLIYDFRIGDESLDVQVSEIVTTSYYEEKSALAQHDPDGWVFDEEVQANFRVKLPALDDLRAFLAGMARLGFQELTFDYDLALYDCWPVVQRGFVKVACWLMSAANSIYMSFPRTAQATNPIGGRHASVIDGELMQQFKEVGARAVSFASVDPVSDGSDRVEFHFEWKQTVCYVYDGKIDRQISLTLSELFDSEEELDLAAEILKQNYGFQ